MYSVWRATVICAVLTLPARSVACAVIRLSPSTRGRLQVKVESAMVAVLPLHVTSAMPERESLTVPVTST